LPLHKRRYGSVHVAFCFESGVLSRAVKKEGQKERRTRLASPSAASSSPVDRGRGKTGCENNAAARKAFRLALFPKQ
jgi:hypothetical protein